MKIEKGIPAPEEWSIGTGTGPGNRHAKWPFRDMEVGDSVFFEGVKTTALGPANAARSYGNKYGKKFISRKFEDGVRVWRVT